MRTIRNCGVAVLAALAACRASPSVQAPTYRAIWDASLGAARESGYEVTRKDARRGVILARRVNPEDGGLDRLKMTFYPSAEGFRVETAIRSGAPAGPPLVGPRPAQTSRLGSRPGQRGAGADWRPGRRIEEEQRLCAAIRDRLAVRATAGKRAKNRSPAP